MVNRVAVTGLVRLAAVLSLAASALHAGLVDEHLDEWWGYGLFFIAASVGQGLYGLILFALPSRPSWEARDWRRWRRTLYAVGVAGNLAVLALYVVTRTSGIPLFGPAAGAVEEVGTIDLVTKGIEALLVGCLLALHGLVQREAPAPRPGLPE